MVRIFNHYLHRRTLVQVLFDLGLIIAALFAVVLSQADSAQVIGLAASYGLSLAGGMFVINSASGLYQQAHKRSLTQSCARALFALLVGLPLIRTSTGHGTAHDIAGRNLADHRNLLEAIRVAAEVAGGKRGSDAPGLAASFGRAA